MALYAVVFLINNFITFLTANASSVQKAIFNIHQNLKKKNYAANPNPAYFIFFFFFFNFFISFIVLFQFFLFFFALQESVLLCSS